MVSKHASARRSCQIAWNRPQLPGRFPFMLSTTGPCRLWIRRVRSARGILWIAFSIIVTICLVPVLRYVHTAYGPVAVPTVAMGAEMSYRSPIPKIIHQVWKTDDIPVVWQKPSESVRKMNPGYDVWLWTDAKALAFLETYYPDFVPTFLSYPYDIQRADSIRYFLIYHYGGIYIDMDIGCNKPVDWILNSTSAGFLAPETWPAGFSNDVFASVPGHPLSRLLIDSLPVWDHWFLTKYFTVFLSTGPAFFSLYIGKYARSMNTSSNAAPGSEATFARIPEGLYSTTGAVFAHFPGSSWHGADVKYLPALLICTFAIAVLSVAWRSSSKQAFVPASLAFRRCAQRFGRSSWIPFGRDRSEKVT